MKFFMFFIISLLSIYVIFSQDVYDETAGKAKRLALLKAFMDRLENQKGLCKEEDMNIVAGKNEKQEGTFVSSFYHGLFNCAKKTLTDRLPMADCLFKFMKTTGSNMQPTCAFCFVKFVECARKNCAMSCSLQICSTTCSSCYNEHCMSEMNTCTDFIGIPQPCKA